MQQRNTNSVVGIIGEGQLALMLCESLSLGGIAFWCYSQLSESSVMASFPERVTSDPAHFREACSVFTLENEFHTVPELKELLGDKADCLFPDLGSYSHFADKISQRTFYSSLGISSPRWMALRNEYDLNILRETFSFPYVIKASKGGYDGKGVRVIKNEQDLTLVLRDFGFHEGQELLVEEKIDILKEVAQGFLRNADGQFSLLPLVETIQENGICNLVHHPADVSPNVQAQIEFFLERMIERGLVGIFNFEFFIDRDQRVIINEGAPRTHNSQHLTMLASPWSQFDLVALYLNRPDSAPRKVPASHSLMVNILGQRKGISEDLIIPEFPKLAVQKKLYGKKKISPGRKMGHVNVVDESGKEDLLSVGRQILKDYTL